MHRGVRHEQSRKGGGIALSAVTFMIWTGVTASAEDAPTVADDAVAAIDDAAGHMLDTAVAVSAADSTVSVGGGVSVDLASDASDGILIDSPTAGELEIGLPFADTAQDATVVDGVIVYDNNNGSSTTPLVHADGSVQILTTIGLYLHFNKAETETLASGGWGATFLSGSCAAAASPAGAVVAAGVGLACFATFGAIVYNAGVAKNSTPEKCVYVKWTPGPGAAGVMVSGTYRDKRCK